jgi:hypothetical protein
LHCSSARSPFTRPTQRGPSITPNTQSSGQTRQFLNTDPIAGLTLAPYSYVNDNPLNYNDPTGLIFGIPGTPSTNQIAGAVGSAANATVSALNTAGKAIDGVAHYAAPIADVTAAGACVAFADVCGPALGVNFLVQEFLAADQSLYSSDYNLGLNQAAILTGTSLGILGLGAVDAAAEEGLGELGRLALGGVIGAPQLVLNAVQILVPEEAVFINCQ